MTKHELELCIEELEKDFEIEERILINEYVSSNNPYKIGDIFTDHIGSILIEQVSVYYSNTNTIGYGAEYYGKCLKKDLTPRKDGSYRNAFQENERKTK